MSVRLSHLGWCTADGCLEEATRRVDLAFSTEGSFRLNVCDDHLIRLQADLEALRGHDIAVEAEKR